MTEDERRLTAYHEAGHAVIAVYSPASDPIHKATIIPRGRALGMVMRLPEGDRVSMAKDKLFADLRVACGGRIAEEMIFGKEKVTTGASSDIRMVTDTARRMVTEWGLSEKLGFLAYEANEQEVFLGRSVSQQKNLSDNTKSPAFVTLVTVLIIYSLISLLNSSTKDVRYWVLNSLICLFLSCSLDSYSLFDIEVAPATVLLTSTLCE